MGVAVTTHYHIDFETRSAEDLRKCGADVYARGDSTDIICLAIAKNDEPPVLWVPGTAWNPQIKPEYTFIAYNAPFELAIWNNVGVKKYGWPKLPAAQTLCTMAMAYAMSLPGKLENAALAVGLEHQKDMEGHRIMMQISQPRSINADGSVVWWDDTNKTQKVYEYCKQDILVERELFKRLMQLSPQERNLWLLDHNINQRGVYVDISAVRTAIKIVELEKDRLNQEIRDVTKGAVAMTTAVGQITDYLKNCGIDVPSIAKAELIELLERDDLPVHCRRVLELRQEAAKSSTAKLEAMVNGVCNDGRSRGLFQYYGANTGRWASRRIQLQNLPRPLIPQQDVDSVFGILEKVAG